MSGIKHEEFGINDNYVLIDAKDSAYIANKAYKIVCQESGSGSFGRVVYARENDAIVVFKNNSIYSDYTLDTNRGLIVFNTQQTIGD
ncbi:hypothetical protein, partial [Streptomyces galilaeus]|uniref:hypothetical protein n=1 Tax=Streptomyces galilaeus TaxID=33899 RepID=UPI0038F80869